MWRKRTRPTPEELIVPDDLHEAEEIREKTRTDMMAVQSQAPFVMRMAQGLINRQGKNHYIETLYEYLPKGSA